MKISTFIFVAAIFTAHNLETHAHRKTTIHRPKRQISVSINTAVAQLNIDVQTILNDIKSAEKTNQNILATDLDNRINTLLSTATTLTDPARACVASLAPATADIKAVAQATLDTCLRDRYTVFGTEMAELASKVGGAFTQLDEVLKCIKEKSAFGCLTLVTNPRTEAALKALPTVIADMFALLVALVVDVLADLVECERVAARWACSGYVNKAIDVADCVLLQ